MRPLVLLPLLLMGGLCPGGALLAQQQESRMEKLIKPDLNQSFDLEQSKSFNSKSYDSRSRRSVDTKNYSILQKVDLKDYLTGNYKGEKSFWMGDFKYSTSAANVTSRSTLVLPKNSDASKIVAVKGERDAQKQYETGTVATRDFRGRESEKLKTSLTHEQASDNGYRGDLHELKSIDDVRTLLNKNK